LYVRQQADGASHRTDNAAVTTQYLRCARHFMGPGTRFLLHHRGQRAQTDQRAKSYL